MSVFDGIYRGYTGEFKGRISRIWAIGSQSFRVQFSGRKIIPLLILCNLPVISFTLMIIFMSIFLGGITGFLGEFFGSLDEATFLVISVTFNPGMIFLPIVFISTLNAGTIANDKKHNSLALYMSRPISRIDYVIGKAISVYFVSAFTTIIPWLTFLLAFTLLRGVSGAMFLETIWVYLSTIASGIVVIFFVGSIVLLFSSMSSQSVLSGILAILILYLPSLLSSIVSAWTNNNWIDYFSISQLITSAVYLMFGKPTTDLFGIPFLEISINGGISLMLMLSIGIICILFTINNLYKEEIN
ncbi:MAG: ABC transporter permease subunit [Candidatus Heimdallarchaeota archaeon]|nr:ABC transporter permease subunit [Candidatus Heimdallarchaeota archaeon]